MILHVIGIPDQHGVIRVSCGGDTIEITIATALPEPHSTSPTSPEEAPAPAPAPSAQRRTTIGDWHKTTAFTVDGGGIGDTAVDRVLSAVASDREAEDRPNPDAVLMRNVGAVDLHSLTRFVGGVAEHEPDLSIALDFTASHDDG